MSKIARFLCACTMIQEKKTWTLSLRLPFILLMQSQESLISPRGKGSNYTKMQHDPSTQILLIVSIAKPRGFMGSSRKWKEEHHVSAGVMLSSKSQTISQIPSGEARISSRIMVNLDYNTNVLGK